MAGKWDTGEYGLFKALCALARSSQAIPASCDDGREDRTRRRERMCEQLLRSDGRTVAQHPDDDRSCVCIKTISHGADR